MIYEDKKKVHQPLVKPLSDRKLGLDGIKKYALIVKEIEQLKDEAAKELNDLEEEVNLLKSEQNNDTLHTIEDHIDDDLFSS